MLIQKILYFIFSINCFLKFLFYFLFFKEVHCQFHWCISIFLVDYFLLYFWFKFAKITNLKFMIIFSAPFVYLYFWILWIIHWSFILPHRQHHQKHHTYQASSNPLWHTDQPTSQTKWDQSFFIAYRNQKWVPNTAIQLLFFWDQLIKSFAKITLPDLMYGQTIYRDCLWRHCWELSLTSFVNYK